jgi:hypothetical protein
MPHHKDMRPHMAATLAAVQRAAAPARERAEER